MRRLNHGILILASKDYNRNSSSSFTANYRVTSPKMLTLSIYPRDLYLSIIIRISGIPALACTERGFELISIQLAKSLDVLIDPIFDSLKKQQSVIKALPKVNIDFAFDENAQ